MLFELKPDDDESRRQGREQVGRYLAALNEAVEPDKKLVGGTGFEGALFLEFENGGALWKLSWRTPEPGRSDAVPLELPAQETRRLLEGAGGPEAG
ncbi:MAG TPA: hypothetical protein VEU33_28275 [Archangium sp.]|nr:hypothetical protein [Archangium sp.]